eukprot:TRINITY_DN4088_c0_g2_i1.p1 TRINITY_DN4088_c0_g2~~TRINITY_DN4088_c0_g2_i1.p1  ORF type:complete len:301 (-),score=116.50 TRINITY_DN4088_c0_g2_i1:9-911(-)
MNNNDNENNENVDIEMFPGLVPVTFKDNYVKTWISEDIPSFDIASYVVGTVKQKAILFCKSKGVLAGVPFFNMVFDIVNCKIKWLIKEGSYLEPNMDIGKEGYIRVAEVTGRACDLLKGERAALNILAMVSGIASKSRRIKEMIDENNWNGSVAATRKVGPGLRVPQKYGVLVGGCDTHRMDLSSMVMLKDNAIESCNGITQAVKKARKVTGFSTKIEVETRNLDEALEAINAGADVIMLDNFSPSESEEVAAKLKEIRPNIIIEASGGITEETMSTFMNQHVDIISSSKLIQGVQHVDS